MRLFGKLTKNVTVSNRTINVTLVLFVVVQIFTSGCVYVIKNKKEEINMKTHALRLAARELECNEQDLEAERIENEFFHAWQFWRISEYTIPPRFLIIATNSKDAHKVTLEDGFAKQVISEPVALKNSEDAIRYVTFFLSVATPLIDLLSSVDDIPGITESEKIVWDEQIRPPVSYSQGASYMINVWLWDSGELINGSFTIEAGGAIQSNLTVVAKEIGVNISIE
jgi:hypothetical protein